MGLETDPVWSKTRSPDGPCSDRVWAPSVVSEVSPIVGTRSSSREVAASSLPSMVSASFAGRLEGILGGKGLKERRNQKVVSGEVGRLMGGGDK